MARLLRQLILFAMSVLSSIVIGWILTDRMERERRRQATAPISVRPADLPPAFPPPPVSPIEPPTASPAPEIKSSAAPTPAAQAPEKQVKPAKPPRTRKKADDLTQIEGIGPAYAKALNAAGITTYEELAQQTPDDLATKLSTTRVSGQRIRNQDWIAQAKQLSQAK